MYKKLFLNFHSNRWSNQIFWSEIKWRFPGSGTPHFSSLIYKNQIPLFVIVEWHFFLRKNSIRSFFSIMMAFFNESHLFDMVSSHANIKAIARRWQKMLRLNLNCVIGLSLHTISQIPDAQWAKIIGQNLSIYYATDPENIVRILSGSGLLRLNQWFPKF